MSLLLEKIVPGATTCVVIGGVQDAAKVDFSRYRAVLWWVDAAHVHRGPRNVARDRLQIAPIETANSSEIAATLQEFVRRDPRRLPSVIITRAIPAQHAEAYRRVMDATYTELEDAHRARVTRQMDGFLWQKHILGNVAAYAHRRLPANWANALQGFPAVVCGAGPSLDVSGAKLAAAADGAVVFAADSALRALARHGVQADFAVSIDVAKVPEKCLPAAHPPARVVLSTVSPPSWQSALSTSTPFYYLSGNQLTDDWLVTQGIARTSMAAIESCGSTAIEVATHFGCDPIYLFGLDLAVDPANQARRHQQDADPGLYVKSNYDPAAKLPRVPGNYAEEVPCFALGDWRALDERLSTRTQPRVFNVTDRGARLRGTIVVHPDQLTVPAPCDKTARLAALAQDPDNSPTASDAALARLRALGDLCAGKIPAMRRALPRDPATVAQIFRSVLLDPDCGRAFGAFSLKVMPHLFPPLEGTPAFWESLVEEFAELAELARTAAPNT